MADERVYMHQWYLKNKEKRKSYHHKWYLENKDHVRETSRKWKENNPEKFRQCSRRAMLKQRYGITLEEFDVLANKQEHKCAICRKETKLNVDHDHKTGKVCGLLCDKCNQGLGVFIDNIDYLKSAIKYLKAVDK